MALTFKEETIQRVTQAISKHCRVCNKVYQHQAHLNKHYTNVHDGKSYTFLREKDVYNEQGERIR